jgi:hypothetical protein
VKRLLHRQIPQLLIIALAAVSLSARAQNAPTASALEQEFKDLQREAREQVALFRNGSLARDPRGDFAARYWALREKAAVGTVAGDAARESLRLLVDAGRGDEALAKLNALPASDPVWHAGGLSLLRDIAAGKGEPHIFLNRARELLEKSSDRAFRARVHYSVGRFYQVGGREADAIKAHEAAVAENAESEFGTRSAREIYDIRELRIGNPAPAFSATTLSGKQVSAASLRGHATVFVYWASW